MGRWLIAVAILFAGTAVYADSWALPTPMSFRSADGRWKLAVTPKQLTSQLDYFEGKVEGDANAGARPGVQDNHPKARLYRKGRFGLWRTVANWRLVNEVSPVSALISADGYVVTFDNWHSMGYGDDVVVIYRPDGQLVRKLALDDLLDGYDISQLRHSVSSIWWSGEHRIDESAKQVVIQVAADETAEFPVSLDTGKILVEKRRLFPPPHVSWTGRDFGAVPCGESIALTGSELESRAVSTPLPGYPIIAEKARIAGDVTVEIEIGGDGSVTAAKVLKPLPFGLSEAAEAAVRTWKFAIGPATCGQVTMAFRLR